MFKHNEGIIDRTLRVTLAIVLLSVGLFLLGGLQGNVPGLFVAGVGLLPLITGLTGFCPLYAPFGISTLEKEKELMAMCSPWQPAAGVDIQTPGKGARHITIRNTHNEEGSAAQG